MAIRPKSVIPFLVFTALTLVLISLASDWVRLGNSELSPGVDTVIRLFVLDGEANVPTFFSVGIITFSACLLLFIANAQRPSKASYTKYWNGLSIIFFVMAFDKFVGIHKLFAPAFRSFSEQTVFNGGWAVLGLAGIAVLAMPFSRFFRSLQGRTRNLFVLTAITYVGAALIVKVVESSTTSEIHEETWAYVLIGTVRESMEMLAIIGFIYALLNYIQRHRIITPILVPAN